MGTLHKAVAPLPHIILQAIASKLNDHGCLLSTSMVSNCSDIFFDGLQ